MIAMTPEEYRSASFLDDRMLQQPVTAAALLPWGEVAAAFGPMERDDARWIFHIGHVGSTLVARLLGELQSVLSVREPRFLRDLTALDAGQRATYIPATRKLFSRSFAADQLALVKATSFVSEIAAELLATDGRALFVYASPRYYIASILAGENSVLELDALAPSRAERMAGRVDQFAQPRNHADLAAAAWACELTSLEAAAQKLPHARIMWVDFDQLLSDVEGGLKRIAHGLEIDGSANELADLADSPLLKRYSKALEFAYSASLRRDLINEAGANFGSEIDGALDLLGASAETSPLLAQALRRAGEN
ncbi:MAG: hypothetical protein ABIR63_02825 [Sphingomicrobium sp.]